MLRTFFKYYLRGLIVLISIQILDAEPVPAIHSNVVTLDVYGGAESILLVWSVPDTVRPVSFTLFRAESLEGIPTIIGDVPGNQFRYRDDQVFPDQRYFYWIEANMATNDRMYTSTLDTPPFERCVSPVDRPAIVDTDSLTHSRLMKVLLEEWVRDSMQATIRSDTIVQSIISRLLLSDQSLEYAWLEQWDISQWENLKQSLPTDPTQWTASLNSRINALEPWLRNQWELTPAEWDSLWYSPLSRYQSRLTELIDNFESNQEILQDLPSVMLLGITSSGPDSQSVFFHIKDPQSIQPEQYNLILDEVPYSLTELFLPNDQTNLTITVPVSHHIELLADNEMLDSMPGLLEIPTKYSGYQRSFSGEYYVISEGQNTIPKRKYLLSQPAVQLNEIVYSSDFNKLSIEVTGQVDSVEQYGLYLNDLDDPLWAPQFGTSFEPVYLDSSWFLDNYIDPAMQTLWVHWAVLNNSSDGRLAPTVVESVPIDRNQSLQRARIPNRELWQSTKTTTLGASNDDVTMLTGEVPIPEVFALYQNYPNPFNGSTTITFDLLQPATISLWVTDARGRIVDVFGEKMNMDRGTYKYQWSGSGHSSGIYFFTIQAQVGNYLPVVYSRKMIYLK